MGDTSDEDFFGAGKALSPKKVDRRESAASEHSESVASDVTKSSGEEDICVFLLSLFSPLGRRTLRAQWHEHAECIRRREARWC